MKSQIVDTDGSADIRVVVLDDGEEAFSSLQALPRVASRRLPPGFDLAEPLRGRRP